MASTTTNFSFTLPAVNSPVDQDIWGDQLNANFTSLDSLLDALVPVGTILPYAGSTAPNSRWLLCYGQAVSRTTYATLFALVSTAYGVGDGSTTFNLPDYRGRVEIGLDNLGGSSANRVTSANADSLNNTGAGSETPAITVGGTVDSHTLTESEIPAHTHTMKNDQGGAGTPNFVASAGGAATAVTSSSTGGGGGHTHGTTGITATGATGSNTQPWIAAGRIIRAL